MYPETRKLYNQYHIRGDVATLTIVRRDKTKIKVKIDAEDVPRVQAMGVWKWTTGRCDQNYTMHSMGSAKMIQLSRFVMLTPDHLSCRFINGDSTDCRKSNLENVAFAMLKYNRTGLPYVYDIPDRGVYSVRCYDPSRGTNVFICEVRSKDEARPAQWHWLRRHPHHRVPGINPDKEFAA